MQMSSLCVVQSLNYKKSQCDISSGEAPLHLIHVLKDKQLFKSATHCWRLNSPL